MELVKTATKLGWTVDFEFVVTVVQPMRNKRLGLFKDSPKEYVTSRSTANTVVLGIYSYKNTLDACTL
jgi:hypothetical protein